jgi:hypothetical protein
MRQANLKISNPGAPEFRRAASDVYIQSGLGNFFASKFRAATLFALYDISKNRAALERAVEFYEKARAAWAGFATGARSTYQSDVTFGPDYFQRGHWLDRLAAIDADLADMKDLLKNRDGTTFPLNSKDKKTIEQAIKTALSEANEQVRTFPADAHIPIASFQRGQSLFIKFEHRGNPKPASIQLHFRRVNQAETWQSKLMTLMQETYRAEIPGSYTNSAFPIQYYFELRPRSGAPFLFPGLNPNPSHQPQPYFVVRQA